MLAQLHHVTGGAGGKGGVQGGDEAVGVEGQRDAGGLFAQGELRRPLFQPARADDPECVPRLHDVGGGGEAVKDEAAG